LTIGNDEMPIIEFSPEIRGRLHVAELILNSLEIPYRIVRKCPEDFWRERTVEIKNKRQKS
jgi:hypothetical protein